MSLKDIIEISNRYGADPESVLAGGGHQVLEQGADRTPPAVTRIGADAADRHGRDPASGEPGHAGVDPAVREFGAVVSTDLIRAGLDMGIAVLDCFFDFHTVSRAKCGPDACGPSGRGPNTLSPPLINVWRNHSRFLL